MTSALSPALDHFKQNQLQDQSSQNKTYESTHRRLPTVELGEDNRPLKTQSESAESET